MIDSLDREPPSLINLLCPHEETITGHKLLTYEPQLCGVQTMKTGETAAAKCNRLCDESYTVCDK